MLEMRTSICRSRSSSSSRSPGAPEYSRPFPYPHARPPLVRTASSDKEHVTIAPIAPTLLKTTGVGNHFVVTDLGGREHTPSTPPVDLVYVPPLGGGYVPRKNSGGVYGEGSSSDDVYRHKGGRFSSSPGTSTSTSASSNSRSPPPTIPTADALPIPDVSSPPIMESPTNESYDYFGSAATVQVLSLNFPANMRQSDPVTDFGPDTGALGVRLGRAVDMPEVVVNDETGAIEERCESRPRSRSHSRSYSRSHSRTPSPAETKAVSAESDTTRIRSTSPTYSSPSLPQDATHLSPADSYPSRGRTPPGMPRRSWSFSNDGHSPGEQGRGRSVTRNSSFSDREHSSSIASFVGGTGSPLGSVSPTGSRAGSVSNGIYSVYVQGHNSVRGGAESTGSRERGRSCADRRVGVNETSTSPPRKTYEGRSLDATIADVSPTSSPVPSTNTPASSALPLVTSPEPSPSTLPPQEPGSPAHPIAPKPTLSIPIPNVSRPTTEEDRHFRIASSTHSPSVLRHVSLAVPAPPTSAPASVLAQKSQSPTRAPSARESLTPPESPTEHGTLVGRASEIVSTARGLFGVLWSGNSGNSPAIS
ncbi:hypothetical protein DFH94DRAFT_115012 [Russula ochroleuca]|uniref:Uncharacterized protein n=1 Tax=Russula ochroleuca TaxID=152965 RepID=A0A9P5MRE5_9AGAM|nr:hypothetical protein DFH94DRAFT_115012 [Russula ochroleuca]